MSDSRTHKSLKNIGVATLMLAVNMLLQFFCRKIFLYRLGSEVLGLNTTATNLLQFLNIAELGVGVAVGFSLYKPLLDDDRRRINEIVALQGHLYRYIGLIVLGGALIISCFFPLIFSKMKLPLWYAYASFGVLTLSALLSYFVNYKEVLLTADQKDYKIAYSFRLCMMLRLVAQYFCVKYLDNPYIWWVVLEGGFAVIAAMTLNAMIRHTYPYLKRPPLTARELRNAYPEIVTKIKQVFFHKISTFVLQQTSTLIIYAFASLTLVAYYGNYMLVVTGAILLLNALFNSIGAGVGNLVAEGDRPHILSVFSELFSVRFFLSALAAMLLFFAAQPFICLWIGREYLLPASTLFIISLTLFLNTSRNSVDSFINAYGLFRDVWAPITEACLNIGLSVLFGWLWGLNGILLGVVVSLVLIVFIWKPYFLYSAGFNEPIRGYIVLYIRHIIALAIACAVVYLAAPMLPGAVDASPLPLVDSVKGFIIYALSLTALTSAVLYLLLMIFTSGMRLFTRRFVRR